MTEELKSNSFNENLIDFFAGILGSKESAEIFVRRYSNLVYELDGEQFVIKPVWYILQGMVPDDFIKNFLTYTMFFSSIIRELKYQKFADYQTFGLQESELKSNLEVIYASIYLLAKSDGENDSVAKQTANQDLDVVNGRQELERLKIESTVRLGHLQAEIDYIYGIKSAYELFMDGLYKSEALLTALGDDSKFKELVKSFTNEAPAQSTQDTEELQPGELDLNAPSLKRFKKPQKL